MIKSEVKLFSKGVHNLLNAEIIPQEAAQDARNWVTIDGLVKLINGRQNLGAEGVIGKITGEIFGYKTDGTTIHWRKAGTKIQHWDGTTWVDTITGLTSNTDCVFSNYSSLAGTFTFVFSRDGIFKLHNANPESYIDLYDEAINFKGYAFIDKGRTILWNRERDKTGLYGSWIDNQREVSGSTGVYTTVTGEATTSLTGTLAFKAGGAVRNCFNVAITLTGTGEVYTDNYDGTLTGSIGGTGTINYITGDYTLSNSGVGTATYQWENSNLRGVTDFRKSATRQAGEGFQFPQDEGGDAILNVLIGQDNAYYSIKTNSTYRLFIGENDLDATNEVYRKEMGVPSFRAAISTSTGIVFINTSQPERPQMTILKKDITGEDVIPIPIFPHFKFENYTYDDCTIDSYDRFILVACKSKGAVNNDTILLCDVLVGSVDITTYYARTFAKDRGLLFAGSSLTETVQEIYSGFDDEGEVIQNYYITKDELFKTERLKKYRKLRLKGRISPDQKVEVYINYDNQGFQLIGTILGSGSYVDYLDPQVIGGNLIGDTQIGGNDTVNVYPYFMEIKLRKTPKFRKRSLMFIAKEIGYIDINYILDWDILKYEERIPSQYRQKQNVSLDGETVNLPAV